MGINNRIALAHKGDPCIYCGTAHDDVQIGPCKGIITMSNRILNDVEEVHHAAIMAGDMVYMQKLGTILERYKKVRKDEVGN